MGMEKNRVICGDALPYLKGLADNSIGLIFTDPPYGISWSGKRTGFNPKRTAVRSPYVTKDWDTNRLAPDYLDNIMRVSSGLILFGGNYYTDMLPPSRGWIIWHKAQVLPSHSDCELIYATTLNTVRLVNYKWSGFVQANSREREPRFHPSQKPVALCRLILEQVGGSPNVVLDPFCGSGSILVAAKQQGLNYIGIDKEPDYCEMAEQRLRQEYLC